MGPGREQRPVVSCDPNGPGSDVVPCLLDSEQGSEDVLDCRRRVEVVTLQLASNVNPRLGSEQQDVGL